MMNSFRIWMACVIAAASRGAAVGVNLKADTSAQEVSENYGETSAWDAPIWGTLKERKASDIVRMADVDMGYSIEDAPWTEELTKDKKVNAILRRTDYATKMRMLEILEGE